MAFSIAIIPFSESLNMFGEPDRNAAYSLSGHVQITLSATTSLFERRRTAAILLRSLVVTFEGQSELVTEDTGYSALRLCSVTQELVGGEPIELSSEGHDTDSPSTWNVVFNLTLPGWLPETCTFGDRDGGTRYALHASAVIQNLDGSSPGSWFTMLCMPFRCHTRLVKATKVGIHLTRFVSPRAAASSPNSLWPLSQYAVSPELRSSTGDPSFPLDVLSKLRVQVTIPERVGTEEDSIPLTIRLRTSGLPESDCKRIRVASFDVDIEQCERYRTTPFPSFVSQFPVPPRAQQPPLRPLLDPHPVQTLYDIGLASGIAVQHMFSKTFSLLPDNASGHYNVGGDGYAFTQDANEDRTHTWFSLQTTIPFSRSLTPKADEDTWRTRRLLRPSEQSPFLGVTHRLYVNLTCTYDISEGANPERATERIRFLVPMCFARVLPDAHSPSRTPSPTVLGHRPSLSDCSATAASVIDLPSRSSPYAHSLPAYSQLFYHNGDRKIDYSVPLPLYTPHPSAADLLVLGKRPSLASDGADTLIAT